MVEFHTNTEQYQQGRYKPLICKRFPFFSHTTSVVLLSLTSHSKRTVFAVKYTCDVGTLTKLGTSTTSSDTV